MKLIVKKQKNKRNSGMKDNKRQRTTDRKAKAVTEIEKEIERGRYTNQGNLDENIKKKGKVTKG